MIKEVETYAQSMIGHVRQITNLQGRVHVGLKLDAAPARALTWALGARDVMNNLSCVSI